jgi:hypothetical protein
LPGLPLTPATILSMRDMSGLLPRSAFRRLVRLLARLADADAKPTRRLWTADAADVVAG